MLKTKSKNVIESVGELYKTRALLKKLKKREDELKEFIKDFLGEESCLDCGPYLVTVKMVDRVAPDMKAIELRLGDEYQEFLSNSPYTTINITEK